MTCIIYQLFKKTCTFIFTSRKIILHQIRLHWQMFVFTLSPFLCLMVCTLPSSWFLVHCASVLVPTLPPNHPLPACMLHVSCACSSIFIVAFYVSRDCNRDLFICAFIHTLTSIRCLSVWKCYVECLYNVCSIRSQMYSFTKN